MYADRVVVAQVVLELTAEHALRGEGDAPRELRREGMEEGFGMRIVTEDDQLTSLHGPMGTVADPIAHSTSPGTN